MFIRYNIPPPGKTWNNIPGHTIFTLVWSKDKTDLLVENSNIKLPINFIKQFPQIEDGDYLVVHWLSSGYYQPKHIGVHVENSYPEEGEEDRELDYIELVFEDTIKVKLSKELSEQIFAILSDEIYSTYLEE